MSPPELPHRDSVVPPGTPIGASREGFLSSLVPRAREYVLALFISSIGSQMGLMTVGWLVLKLSSSALAVGAVAMAAAIPRLIILPIGGVLADRVDRRRLLWMTLTFQLGCALLQALLIAAGTATVWTVGALVFLDGVAFSLWFPAHQATIVEMVDRRQVGSAISVLQAQFNLSRMVGPTIAGAVIAAFGAAACFGVAAASFLPFLVVINRLPAKTKRPARTRSPWEALLGGLRYARRHRSIPTLLWLAASIAFFGTQLITLAPVFAIQFSPGSQGLGAMLTSIGIGTLISTLLVARQGDVGSKAWWLQGGAAVIALTLAGFSQSSSNLLSFGLLVLFGAALAHTNGLAVTILHFHAPNRMRGRLTSLFAVAVFGFSALGSLAAGALADWSSPALVPLVGSVGIAVTLIAIRLVRPLPREG